MSIVRNIKLLCTERGTNITELERMAGISQGQISKWDKHKPSAEKVLQVAAILDISVDDLMNSSFVVARLKTCEKKGDIECQYLDTSSVNI